MIYFETAFLTVIWHETAHYSELQWTGFGFGEAYRTAMAKVLDLHRRTGSPWMLSDMRKAAVIATEDAGWLTGDWLESASAAGLRRIAVVLPASVVVQMQVEQLRKKPGVDRANALGLATNFFSDGEEARRWVLAG